jgi:hypothetical protein
LTNASSTPSDSTTSRCTTSAPKTDAYQEMAASMSLTAIATWSISVS